MELEGKKILLTGAAGGIGSALSRQLAGEGAQLVLCGIGAQSLEKLAQDLSATGSAGSFHVIVADVGNAEDRSRIASECEQLGGIDVLINLAGVMDFRLFENQPAEVIEKTLQINLLSPILLCHDLLPQLKRKSSATILNVGSIFGSIGHPGFVAYCASKAGVKTFSEALARELADTGVSVSYIAPRATATNLNTDHVTAMNTALGNKMDSPDYVAHQIVRQLRNGRILGYLGWPEKLFVRINALLPSVVHKALVKNLGLIKKYASN